MAGTDVMMRCNDLRCRIELTENAVVTTCSHIFCFGCAESHGLLRISLEQRICPACNTTLHNDDDCVATALNPPEDYKTSILSGLSPTTIMECAGRALAFYSYQASNAVKYQEHLAQSLTAKYSAKHTQLQEELFFAQREITKLRDMVDGNRKQLEAMENKQIELTEAFKEKSRALADTQQRYNQLKAQAMAADVQSAASDQAEHTLFPSHGPSMMDPPAFQPRRQRTRMAQAPPSRLPTRAQAMFEGGNRNFVVRGGNSSIPMTPSRDNTLGVHGMTSAQRQRTRLPIPAQRGYESGSYGFNAPSGLGRQKTQVRRLSHDTQQYTNQRQSMHGFF